MSFDVYTLFNSPTINTEGNTQSVNPLYQYRNLDVIEDPTINTLAGGFGNVMPWFMTASTTDTAFIEVDYLNGQEIPTIRRMETPGQLGFVWDIYLDWGINVMDYPQPPRTPRFWSSWMADRLLALAHIQVGFAQYKPGDFLPADRPEDTAAWIEAGTAMWVPEDYHPPSGVAARPVTAEPGLPGIAVGGELTGNDLIGKIPETVERRRRKCRA